MDAWQGSTPLHTLDSLNGILAYLVDFKTLKLPRLMS